MSGKILANAAKNISSYLAAIGDFPENRFVWRSSILVSLVPRLLISWSYRKLFIEISFPLRYIRDMIQTGFLMNMSELCSLVFLSFIDGDNHHRLNSLLHKVAFASFLISSSLYFLLQLYLIRYKS